MYPNIHGTNFKLKQTTYLEVIFVWHCFIENENFWRKVEIWRKWKRIFKITVSAKICNWQRLFSRRCTFSYIPGVSRTFAAMTDSLPLRSSTASSDVLDMTSELSKGHSYLLLESAGIILIFVFVYLWI